MASTLAIRSSRPLLRAAFNTGRPAAQRLQILNQNSTIRRHFATPSPSEQPRIRLGSIAPNFQAKTTHGDIDFHKFIGDSWAILFSHPADFTPVCTTELGAFAKLKDEFDKRNVKMIGLSANDLTSHDAWIKDINEVSKINLQFPIIADADRKVAFLYDMIDQQDLTNIDQKGIAFTIRSVFVIDPSKKVRLTMMYPASTGRNTSEVLRVIDSLQMGDKKGVTTPIDWQVGEDVIVPPSVSTADAKKKFGEVREVKPYLRFTKI
ncbi:putative tsa family thioredoxin [Phaeomoniella chlamydospora]|uniref:Putative tsa family thioredoxin n=1 Tax=Phaeomoniella chlamydospora TaxID=158046 RepID=A0A0G2EAB1_PHACM|nr:putative tsa family thioredoxin [Phaeomoniella chlamydospora]